MLGGRGAVAGLLGLLVVAVPLGVTEGGLTPRDLLASSSAYAFSLEAIRHLENPDSLEGALWLLRDASLYQVGAYGQALDLQAFDRRAPDALPAWLPDLGGALSEAQERALGRVLNSFARYQGAWDGAAQSVLAGDTLVADSGVLDFLAARWQLLDAMLALAEAFPAPIAVGPVIQFAPVLALDLAGVDSMYTDDFALLIDVGGNDVYLNNAGGSDILGDLSGSCSLLLGGRGAAAALLDLSGNDRYISGRSCGVNGGGHLGSGMLVDLAGSDEYRGGFSGVNGGAVFGFGLVLDGEGADTYAAGPHGSNGGGGPGGVGLLVDLSGGDRYHGSSVGSNGGGSIGVGMLVDGGGDDRYVAGPYGTNGGTENEIGTSRGFLLDLSGNETYIAGWGGTNGGSYGGTGFLFDVAGDDVYSATSVGVNGGAEPLHGCFHICFVNPALGLLLDGGGSDSYYDEEGGSGLDASVIPKGVAGAQLDLPSPPLLAGLAGR